MTTASRKISTCDSRSMVTATLVEDTRQSCHGLNVTTSVDGERSAAVDSDVARSRGGRAHVAVLVCTGDVMHRGLPLNVALGRLPFRQRDVTVCERLVGDVGQEVRDYVES